MALGILLLSALPAGGQSNDGLADAVRRGLEDAFAGELVPEPLAADDAWTAGLRRFYDLHDHRPVWVGPYGPHPDAEALIAALRRADSEGLDPDAFDIETLERLLAGAEGAGALVRLELGLSRALLKYASDLRHGRLAPDAVEARPPPNGRMVEPAELLTGAASAGDLRRFLAGLPPRNRYYQRLRRALATYRGLAEAGPWPTLPDEPRLMKPGLRDPAVAVLRQRLRRTRDLTVESDDPTLFDSAMELAVRRFQDRHGLEVDGVVGPDTRRALNVPAATRIRQIVLNMERWRWMPDDLGERYILVNLAGFTAELVESGQTTIRMRAVVGRPYRRTPVFSDRVTYLEFNPTWTVPPTIAEKDVLPEAVKDPGYFAEENMDVYRGWSADAPKVDPTTVNWAEVDPRRIPFRFVQRPGPKNALGRVKFMFPNKYHVYLHDTPQRELFERAQRTFSSGCIRIDKPMTLAESLLADVPGWDRNRIDRVVAGGKQSRVRLNTPVPIHLIYATVWLGEGGTIHFGQDVYGRDSLLDQALAAAEGS